MVRLTKIYTRTGDDGTTGLGDGTRVDKTCARIEAYGTVDELNSVLAMCLDTSKHDATREGLLRVQNDLFDLGADLCVPIQAASGTKPASPPAHVGEARVKRLEAWIDEVNADLEPLQSFVLPGGNPAATAFHFARTVCRRAERRVLALMAEEPVDRFGLAYLNRLSDLLFVLARAAAGGDERLWQPSRDGEDGAS